ncbi:MAG: hypothetical protein HKP30_08615 [Myxococcales bacterium]|nr:hypothetical protein [Myxococcales bacterium]
MFHFHDARRGLAPQRALLSFAAIGLLLLGAASPARAATFTSGLAFSTGTRSLWGPGGGSSSFGGSGSLGTRLAGVDVGAGYDFSATAGTVRANLSGSLVADYAAELALPGVTQIGLDWNGSSGSFSTDLGASAEISAYVHDVPFFGPWDPCVYCQDWSLDTSRSFTSTFGVQRSDTDSFSVAGVGPDIGVASAQLSLNANQTARFRPDALTGSLRATHRDSGLSKLLGFSLQDVSVLDVDLDEAGIWDFDLLGLDIANTFSTTIGANLSVDLECCFGAIGTSFPFGNVSLLNTPSFALDFGARNLASAFSILVVPEPGATGLVLLGLGGLLAAGRRSPGA